MVIVSALKRSLVLVGGVVWSLLDHHQVQLMPDRFLRHLTSLQSDHIEGQLSTIAFYLCLVVQSCQVLALSATMRFEWCSAAQYFAIDPMAGSLWLVLRVTRAPVMVLAIAPMPLFSLYIDHLMCHLICLRDVTLFGHLFWLSTRAPPSQPNNRNKLVNTVQCFPRLSRRIQRRVAINVQRGNRFVTTLSTLLLCMIVSLTIGLGRIVWLECFQAIIQSDHHQYIYQYLYHFQHRTQFLLDLCMVGYSLYNVLRLLLFALFYMAVLWSSLGHHMRHWHTKIQTCSKRLTRRVRSTKQPRWVSTLLHRYEHDWLWVLRLGIDQNGRLVSRALMIAIATHLPLNMCLVVSVVRFGGQLMGGELLLALFIILAQTLILVGFSAIFIRTTDRLYGGHSLLYAMQPKMTLLRVKLKLMALHELTCTRRKFHFTAGPGGKITRRTIYEFLYIYSASLMFAFRVFQQQHLLLSRGVQM